MLKGLHHIAIIVSCEEALDFYKKLGFKELSREYNEAKNYTCLFYRDDNDITLELFIKDGGDHQNNPETRGLRHVSFLVDNVDEVIELLKDYEVQKSYTMENGKRIVFIFDYDKQPIEFAEIGSINV